LKRNDLIEVNNISKTFNINGSDIRVLDDVSFTVNENSIFAIVGLSGCGKTTLVKIMLGLIEQDKGSININGENHNYYLASNKLQPVFQNNYNLVHPSRKVISTLDEVCNKYNQPQILIEGYLDRFKLSKDLLSKKGFQLSGGEQQKIAFIKILLSNPEIIILDEIFSAQDNESKEVILDIIKEYTAQKNRCAIIVSHNISLIKEICNDGIVLFSGKVIERGSLKEIFQNPKHTYTELLIKSEDYELTPQDLNSLKIVD
jgi:peptide/nickel transport system ATP-binding protein